ncbi:hypothetical protein [Hymenobacter norwichensis]|uniref:hypothetical protein n=1 Tax=Hymenobacter norwichensis TaxID=223903 RepID=UPI0012F9D7B4|nr:hypothetical protein [Hymenobacter norwichensis]
MFKRLLFMGALAAFASPAFAQSVQAPIAPQATIPDSIPTTFGKWYLARYEPSATVADTAGALVSLYATKRNNTWWWLPVAPLGLAFIQPGEESINGVKTRDIPPDSWQYVVGVPMMIGGVSAMVVRLSTYSRDNLRQIQHDYEVGKPIPAKLRRKLKPEYFASAAVMRVTIMQQLQLNKLKEQQRAARKK